MGFNFKLKSQQFQVLKNTLPPVIGNMAKRYFVGAFTKQAWDGRRWAEVNRRQQGTPEYKYPKAKDLARRTRGILIGKGGAKMRRGVNNSLQGSPTWNNIEFKVSQDYSKFNYAQVHNQGDATHPKRQFIGYAKQLSAQMKKKINSEMTKVLRGR